MSVTIDQNSLGLALATVGALILVVGPRVKQAVDVLRMSFTLPPWGPAASAFGFGFVISLLVLYLVYSSQNLPFPIILALVLSVLTAFGVTADATGITQNHDLANNVVEKKRAHREAS